MSAELHPTVDQKSAGVFPVAYGNEEESGIIDNTSGTMDEPYKLAAHLVDYVPYEVQGAQIGPNLFLRNGSKIYAGGLGINHQPTNVERATQECAQPSELALAIQAEELLLIKLAERYVTTESAEQHRPITLRSQRRVIDGKSSRKGCHDNFALASESPLAEIFDTQGTVPDDLLAYGASKSIIDGAGYVRLNGIRFSQKVGGLKSIYGYAYLGSMYRLSTDDGNSRFEVRHNDINISDWAIQVRVGGMAIALALSQTPLAAKMPTLTHSRSLIEAKNMNRLALNEDGTITADPDLLRAIDMQQAVADLALNQLGLHVEEMPEELYWAARERYVFCEDLKRVVRGEATIALLRDRADWAAKMTYLLGRIHRDRDVGISRSLLDTKSRATDMRYDYREFKADDGKLQKTKVGFAYKLRELGEFQGRTYTPRQVTSAYRRPIPGTRASIRGHLVEHYDISNCNWDSLAVCDGPVSYKFEMKDVLQTELSDWDKHRLSDLKKIR